MAGTGQYHLPLSGLDPRTLGPDTIATAQRWLPICRARLAAQRKAHPMIVDRRSARSSLARPAPAPRKVAQVLVDTAADLRRGVEPTMVARRLDNLAADIDPTITTGLTA